MSGYRAVKGSRLRSRTRSMAGNKGWEAMDYEKMSNAELHSLLKDRFPAVAETVREVRDSNREMLIAFLNFLRDESR